LPENVGPVAQAEVVAKEVDQVYAATSVTNLAILLVNVRWRVIDAIIVTGSAILPKTVIKKLMKLESVTTVASPVTSRETVQTLMGTLKLATDVLRRVMLPGIAQTMYVMIVSVTTVGRQVTYPGTVLMNVTIIQTLKELIDANVTGVVKWDILLVIVLKKILESRGRRIALVTTVVR